MGGRKNRNKSRSCSKRQHAGEQQIKARTVEHQAAPKGDTTEPTTLFVVDLSSPVPSVEGEPVPSHFACTLCTDCDGSRDTVQARIVIPVSVCQYVQLPSEQALCLAGPSVELAALKIGTLDHCMGGTGTISGGLVPGIAKSDVSAACLACVSTFAAGGGAAPLNLLCSCMIWLS